VSHDWCGENETVMKKKKEERPWGKGGQKINGPGKQLVGARIGGSCILKMVRSRKVLKKK